MKKINLIIFSALILVVIFVFVTLKQNDNSPALHSNPPRKAVHLNNVAIGEIADINSLIFQVVSISRSDGTSTDIPKDGNLYIIINIAIRNDTDFMFEYSEDIFKLSFDKNTINSSSISSFSTLSSGELAPGGLISGNLIFEVPSGDYRFNLECMSLPYSDSVIFDLDRTLDSFELLNVGTLFQSYDIYQIGDEVELMGAYISVLNTDTISITDTYGKSSLLTVATISVKNIGYPDITYGPQFYKLCNKEGHIIYSVLDSSLSDNALTEGELKSGESISKEVFFICPAACETAFLIYEGPHYYGGPYNNTAVFQISH